MTGSVVHKNATIVSKIRFRPRPFGKFVTNTFVTTSSYYVPDIIRPDDFFSFPKKHRIAAQYSENEKRHLQKTTTRAYWY